MTDPGVPLVSWIVKANMITSGELLAAKPVMVSGVPSVVPVKEPEPSMAGAAPFGVTAAAATPGTAGAERILAEEAIGAEETTGETVTAGLTELAAELAGEAVTADAAGAAVEAGALAPPTDAAGATTAPTGTSAAEASMINETKTASHAALLRDDIGRPVTFPDPRRMGRPHPAGRVQGAPGCQQRPRRLARRPGDYNPASDPGKPTRSWDLHRFSAAGAGRVGARRTPASRPDHETRR